MKRHVLGGILLSGLVVRTLAAIEIKPAKLAHPGTCETDRGNSHEQIVVGYGFPNMPGPPVWSWWPGVRHYVVIPPEQPWDDRWTLGGPAQVCTGDSGGSTYPGPLGDSGQKRRSVLAITSATAGNCPTGSIFARIDNQDVQPPYPTAQAKRHFRIVPVILTLCHLSFQPSLLTICLLRST